MDNKSKKIYLAMIESVMQVYEQEAVQAVERAEKAKKALEDFKRQKSKEIRLFLNKGYTTGDLLQDEIIWAFGLDFEILKRISAFNKLLINSAGHEMLLGISRREQHTFHDPLDEESNFPRQYSFVFGILSGQPLQISGERWSDNLRLELPLNRYVTSDVRAIESMKPFEGKLTLSEAQFGGLLGGSVIHTLIESLGKPWVSERGNLLAVAVWVGRKISPPINPSEEAFWDIVHSHLGHARILLSSATEEEKLCGGGI